MSSNCVSRTGIVPMFIFRNLCHQIVAAFLSFVTVVCHSTQGTPVGLPYLQYSCTQLCDTRMLELLVFLSFDNNSTPAFHIVMHVFQMPGIPYANNMLPEFPNIWPYTTEHFANAKLSVKLQMCNKLVVKAKKSIFFVIANGPRDGEHVVQWQVRVGNVQKRLR